MKYVASFLAAWMFWAVSAAYSIPLHLFLNGAAPSEPVGNITFIATRGSSLPNNTNANVPITDVLIDDIVIAAIATDTTHNASGTPPSGWTKLHQINEGSDSTLSTFWKRITVDASQTTEAFTNIFDATETGWCITLTYRGCINTGSPIEVNSTGEQAFSTTWTRNIVTLGDNRMVVAIFGGDCPTPFSFTWTSPINERVDTDNGGFGYITAGDVIASSVGAVTMSGTALSSAPAAQAVYSLVPQ